jgi:hypothetical protein
MRSAPKYEGRLPWIVKDPDEIEPANKVDTELIKFAVKMPVLKVFR